AEVHFINMAPRKQTHKADSIGLSDAWSWGALAKRSPGRQLHLEGRALAERRLHPDAAAVHLDNLLGDSKTEARAALRLRKRAVDLVELLEDARLLRRRNTGTRVSDADGEVPIDGLGGHTHLADVGELDSIADEVEEHLRQALLVTEANG